MFLGRHTDLDRPGFEATPSSVELEMAGSLRRPPPLPPHCSPSKSPPLGRPPRIWLWSRAGGSSSAQVRGLVRLDSRKSGRIPALPPTFREDVEELEEE